MLGKRALVLYMKSTGICWLLLRLYLFVQLGHKNREIRIYLPICLMLSIYGGLFRCWLRGVGSGGLVRFVDFDGGDVAGGLFVGGFGMVAVLLVVVLECIAVVGEGGHDEVALYPVFVFPRGGFAEPDFVIDPVCLEHVGGLGHIEIQEVAAFVESGFVVFGFLDGDVYPLEYFKWDTFLVGVGVVEVVEDEAYPHGGPAFSDSLLLDEVAHVDEVDEDGREGYFHFHVGVPDDAEVLPVINGYCFEERR